jgi:hypothetical protein
LAIIDKYLIEYAANFSSRRQGTPMSPPSSPDALGLSRRVLRILIKLNWLLGFLILALLVASLVAAKPVMGALGVDPSTVASAPHMLGMRLRKIAWAVLALEVLHLVVVAVAANVSTATTPLREDLEGTV